MGPIKKIQDMQKDMAEWRQKLHSHPELAFEEVMTSAFIQEKLQSFGIETHVMASTGVVGVLHGAGDGDGKSVMLRADMDALPIQEDSGVSYSSTLENAHHACGHDGHMTMLLGAAKYLSENKDFSGTVYLLFQPAEEHIGGAQKMIDEGLFDRFPADAVYGLHNFPGLPLGMMASMEGAMLAGSDEFHIVISGEGGHAARPENTTDILGAAAEVLMAVKTISQKEIPAGEVAQITVCSIHSDNDTANVLPMSIQLQGAIRTYDAALQDRLKECLEAALQEMATKYAAHVSVEYKNGYPILVNSPLETEFALDVAKDVVGEQMVMTPVPRSLGVEDFAFYMQLKPGNFMAIGTGDPAGGKTADLHSAKYDFNDAALPVGATYWVKLVEKALPKKAPKPKP